jgi:hypothetical protein
MTQVWQARQHETAAKPATGEAGKKIPGLT